MMATMRADAKRSSDETSQPGFQVGELGGTDSRAMKPCSKLGSTVLLATGSSHSGLTTNFPTVNIPQYVKHVRIAVWRHLDEGLW